MPAYDVKLTISEELLNKCTQFAKDSVNTSADKYARRNQSNISKIIEDIRNGKIAEEVVWSTLSKIYPNLSQPDFNIYDKKNKNWNPDLRDQSIPLKLAVKSQEIKSEIAYGRSWVFQYGNGKFDCDTGVFGTIDDTHYVSFVSLNIPKRTAEIHAIVRIKWLHENKLFKPMKMKNLQNNKLAVYYEDLIKLPNQLLYHL